MKLSPNTHPNVFARAEWFFIGSILLGILINFFWPIWTVPLFIRIALGIIFLAISTSILYLSWQLFQKEKTTISPYKPNKTLIVRGPYKYSRNPQYLSRVLTQMALGFFFGNIWIVITVVPAIFLVWYGVILPEERYLEQRFGKKYLQYKASVRCWF